MLNIRLGPGDIQGIVEVFQSRVKLLPLDESVADEGLVTNH